MCFITVPTSFSTFPQGPGVSSTGGWSICWATLDTEEVAKRAEGSLDFGVLCQRVDGVHRRMELQTGTEVQLPDVPPGSRVLANEGAVLIKRYLSPFAVVHQAVVAI